MAYNPNTPYQPMREQPVVLGPPTVRHASEIGERIGNVPVNALIQELANQRLVINELRMKLDDVTTEQDILLNRIQEMLQYIDHPK